jgi:hypothetical protein
MPKTMTKKERELYGIERINEKDELGQLIAYSMKVLKYDLTKDYVESIHNFHL